MILVLTFPGNAHAQCVLDCLTRDVEVVDLASFPNRLAVDVRLGAGEGHVTWIDGAERRVDAREFGAVWRRRLRSYELDDALTDPTARMFARSETDEAVNGLLAATRCVWVNSPGADDAAQHKIHQLDVAVRVGLSIPETLVTSDPASARAFIESFGPGNVICKAFRNIAEAPRWTRRVSASDLANIDSVRYAPVTFQEFVPAQRDLRVTVVEDEVFAASIVVAPPFETDYRPGLPTATVEPYTLPDEVVSGLHRLMDEFGLRYGAIDMRVTPEGEHVFLEVNSGGEFLFAAERTGQPVAQAIASCLERHDREHAG